MVLPNLPEVSRLEGHLASWLRLLCLRRRYWHTCNNNCSCEMSFFVWLTTPSQRSCHVPWRGRPVAWRWIVVMASLVEFEVFVLQGFGASHWERADSALWERWWWCHRLSLLVVTVPSSDFVSLLNFMKGILFVMMNSFYFQCFNCSQLSQMTNRLMLIRKD